MTALYIFISTFISVFALGMQSQLVNNGHHKAAFCNSFVIGVSHLVLYKSMPEANITQIAAFLLAGPIAIVLSMIVHRKYFKKEG